MDIKTLPDEYEEIKPQRSGFRFFVVFCCVALLGIGGLGLYNWLGTGSPYGLGPLEKESKATIERYLESSPDKVDLSESPKLESEVKDIVDTTIPTMTKDAVTVNVKVRSLGELPERAKEELRFVMSGLVYNEVPNAHNIFLKWIEKYDITIMELHSKKPLN